MPTYDYQCRSCGASIEVIHGMREDGPTTCEACGGPLRRVLYPTGIIFKGSGFYRTDSRKQSSSSGSGGSSKGADSGSAGTDGGSKDGGSSTSSDAASTSSSTSTSTSTSEAAS